MTKPVSPLYDDGRVCVDAQGVTLRRYYFPIGTPKHIGYDDISAVTLQDLGTFSGRYRIWGTDRPTTTWMPLDVRRPSRSQAVRLDLGTRIAPVFTPDDPEKVVELIRARLITS